MAQSEPSIHDDLVQGDGVRQNPVAETGDP